MLVISENWETNIKKQARSCTGKVEIYNGSTLLYTCLPEDKLVSIKVEKTSNKKMFGFSIAQLATIELIDPQQEIELQQGYKVKAYLGCEDDYATLPNFYIDSFEYKDTLRKVTIKAYDVIRQLDNKTFSQLNITYPKNLKAVFANSEWPSSISDIIYDGTNSKFNYAAGDLQRQVLDDICAITGTVCVAGNNDKLVFKQITVKQTPDLTIDRSNYFSFTNGDSKQLTGIVSSTELGDNVEVGNRNGYVYVMHDNGCINLNNQAATILRSLFNRVNGLTLTPYVLNWRANPALEVGDTIAVQKKDDTYTTTVYMGEDISYNGGINSKSEYELDTNQNPDANPISLGEAINKTYARVDKVAGEITLLASTVDSHSSQIASLVITSGQIESRVETVEDDVTTMQSTISQMPDQIRLAVEADIADDYYAKVSSIDINTNGIEIKSTGTITIDSGADLVINSGGGFEVHTTNFTIDSSGNVTIKGSISSGSIITGATISSGTVTGSTITGGTINIGNGNFTVSSNGTVSLAGVATFNPESASWYGSSFDKGVDMSYLEIGHINDNNNTPKSNNWAITAGGTGYFQALESQSGNWSIASDGTCTGLKAIAVFGA